MWDLFAKKSKGKSNLKQIPQGREFRISLDEEGFSKLINNGYVVIEEQYKITITPEELDVITRGGILGGNGFKMILQDIGYDRIFLIMENSKNKWFL